jgi:hypothetical protein
MSEIRIMDELPEGAMPEQVIEMYSFLNSDGERRWDFRCQGDVPVSMTFGLIEMVKHHMMMQAQVFRPPEED